MLAASAFSQSVFAGYDQRRKARRVRSAEAILNALEARKVSRSDLAKALGISQPNATKLYQPDSRTGKTRTLSYDEGRLLIDRFQLDDDRPALRGVNVELLGPLLEALLPLVPRSGLTEKSAPILGEVLAYGLELLAGESATQPGPGELRIAARGAAARFRDLLRQ